MRDSSGRTISYLRVSLTDRCNLRCKYCMPEKGVDSLSHYDILRYEEFECIIEAAAQCGIEHIRLTGGEPLVRKGIIPFISRIQAIEGINDISITTNAQLLESYASDLKQAGVTRINISLDTLSDAQFLKLTRCGSLEKTLDGIEAALAVGFDPVKINVVAMRSLQQDFHRFAQMTITKPLHVRFIEYMPIGGLQADGTNTWNEHEIIRSDEIRSIINEKQSLLGLPKLKMLTDSEKPLGYGPARYYALPHAKGTIGFISAWSNHFCSECNRMRLTADGKLRPCLFSDEEIDLRAIVRSGTDKTRIREELIKAFEEACRIKPGAHHNKIGTKRNMSQIGG